MTERGTLGGCQNIGVIADTWQQRTDGLSKGPVIIYGRGGAESKVGGGRRKYFEVQRVGIKKKSRSHEWASKNFLPKIFAAGAASFKNLNYLFT